MAVVKQTVSLLTVQYMPLESHRAVRQMTVCQEVVPCQPEFQPVIRKLTVCFTSG